MLRNDEFEVVTENVLSKVMVITRDIKAGEKVTYVISNTESPIVNQTDLRVVSEEDVLVKDVVVSQGGIYARGRGNATVQNATAKGDITTIAGVGTEEEMNAMNAFLSKLK